jgi:hypothetical protein
MLLRLLLKLMPYSCFVVANPVKSDVFAFKNNVASAAFKANAVFVASVVANPVKSDVFAFRANAVTSAFLS